MLKNILKLEGTKSLTSNEKKIIMGGRAPKCCLEWNPITQYCSKWDYACLNN